MTKRIFRSIFLVSLIVLLACLVIIMGVLYEYFSGLQKAEIKAQAYMAADGVTYGGGEFLTGLENSNCRITWIGADGTVLYDNVTDSESMENHTGREEVAEALDTGYGESSRYSVTLMERQIYSAVALEDGTVIRTSATQYTMLAFVMIMLQPIIVVIIAAIALSLFLASRLSKRIVKPLNDLNLDEPLSNEGYDELAPLMTRLENQQRQIKSQMLELKRRREEFEAVTGSMNEGLVLLGDKGTILSINNAALELFNTDRGCIGQDIMTIDRSIAVQKLLKEAAEGRRSETVLELNGREYQLDASPIVSDDTVAGTALLIFDVTEKVGAEQLRREFTANVSHELKTPLHSISGCAELLNNDMVKPEDVKQFTEQIYFEAQRMMRLVDDIIRLSRLDEGAEDLNREQVNVMDMAKEVVRSLEPAAKERNITVELCGDQVVFESVPQLLMGVIYNLCDNAIKYNKDGGSVTVSVGKTAKEVSVTVADTGIGIPERHQQRVFERFYRVDKSHSKKIGGTGLGLSIVKHSVGLLGGRIELQSAEGKGTTITVSLPL